MSINEIETKARELRELQILIDEATAETKALEDALKAAMGDAEEIRAGAYKIMWKAVTSARIDTGALRKALRRCSIHQGKHRAPLLRGVERAEIVQRVK